MTQISCFLVVLLAFMLAHVVADIPWSSSSTLPFPGHPAMVDGAWFATAGSDSAPQFTLISNGQGVGQRVNSDGTLRTTIYTITSFICLDESTARYMWTANVSTDGGAAQGANNCAVARVNATHRVLVNYDESEGKCPDLTSVDNTNGFATSNATGVVRYQVFERVDGVMPGPPTLMCKNSTTPLPEPSPAQIGDPTLGATPPANLEDPAGPTTPSGVWKSAGTLEMISPKGFAAAIIAEDGSTFAVMGAYLSHRCLSSDSYLATNEQFVSYNNGTKLMGYHCEWGQRQGASLAMRYSAGPDCSLLADSNAPPDLDLALIKSLPGIPIECVAVTGPPPGPAPPSSSAVGAAAASVLATAIAVAFT